MVTFLLGALPAWAHREDHPTILVLYYRQKEAPYAQTIKAELAATFNARLPHEYELITDTIEGWTNADPGNDRLIVEAIGLRYSRMNVHLLIPVGNGAVEFARLHGRELFPEASIVYMAEAFPGIPRAPTIPGSTGVVLQFDVAATLRLALQQFPATRHVVVVGGNSTQERMELMAAQTAIAQYGGAIDAQYLTDVTFPELLKKVAILPQDAVVILLNFSRDAAGDEFHVGEILPSISRAASRPIYVVYGTGVGAGALGGQVHEFAQIGRALANLSVQILAGAKPTDLPVEESTFERPTFDWRQMERWGVTSGQLPPGSLVLNYEPTAWGKYNWWILSAIGVLLAQAALISFLVLARIRKLRAERELARHKELESLVVELAIAFISLPTASVGEEIERSCSKLLRFFCVDRIALFEFTGVPETVCLLYSYQLPDTEPGFDGLPWERWAWAHSVVKTREPLFISNLSDVPANAMAEREYLQHQGIRSMAIIPLEIENSVSGIFVLAAAQEEVRWDERFAKHLQTVSIVFANALARSRSDEALRSSEYLKTAVLDSLIANIAVLAANGDIIGVNKGWKEFATENKSGEQASLVGANYLEECRRAVARGCTDAKQALIGIESVLQGDSTHFEMEYECSSPREERWFAMSAMPLVSSGKGAVIRHLDVTFRVSAMAMLRESEQRFRLVADSSPVLIWMSEPDGLCSYFNKPWLDFTGRSIEQECGRGWTDGLHPEDSQRCLSVYSEAVNGRHNFTIEYRLRRFDGVYRWLLDNGVPRYRADGTFAGFIGACIDVTERKESDEARSQLAGLLITAQEQERATIARELHDHINQRLALLAIELQNFGRIAKISPKELREIDRFWSMTGEIARDLQALSHQLHSSQLQHLGFVPAIRSLCQEFSKANAVEAEFRCTEPVPHLDENASLTLFRVAQEALRNVSQYGRAQVVRATLSYENSAVVLRIMDDGIGFDPGVIRGRGLGLISMYERMRLAGGELTIHSCPGAGTQIEARLPIVKASPTIVRAIQNQ